LQQARLRLLRALRPLPTYPKQAHLPSTANLQALESTAKALRPPARARLEMPSRAPALRLVLVLATVFVGIGLPKVGFVGATSVATARDGVDDGSWATGAEGGAGRVGAGGRLVEPIRNKLAQVLS